MEVGFTPRQVTRLTGVPYSTLNLWAKNGLVRPSIAIGRGSGNERIYSFSDLAALKVALELRKAGVTTRSLLKVVQFVHEHLGMQKPLTNARLVVSGNDVLVVENDKELISTLSKPGQSSLSFVVDLPKTLGELVTIANQTKAFAVHVSAAEETPPLSRKQATSASASFRRRRA